MEKFDVLVLDVNVLFRKYYGIFQTVSWKKFKIYLLYIRVCYSGFETCIITFSTFFLLNGTSIV